MVFDADPSSDAEITSEAIDPDAPLGIMDDNGNIVAYPAGASTADGIPGQKVLSKERIIDVGHAEKCVTDVRELVGPSFNHK